MGDPVLRAGAIVTRGNDLLMVRSGGAPAAPGGSWSVPTAAVRDGETMVESVVRAVGDQTGLDALCGTFLGWFETLGSDAGHDVTLCFAGVVLDVVAEPRSHAEGLGSGAVGSAGHRIVEAAWMPVWDVSEQPLADGLAELLADHGIIDTLT